MFPINYLQWLLELQFITINFSNITESFYNIPIAINSNLSSKLSDYQDYINKSLRIKHMSTIKYINLICCSKCQMT